ncbi:sulfatase-like hydrolase/transferase [Prosthecobacter sp.]|uniref:sulfatase family protein n=1 Tax=Prosthecobacter sp. TaxID=1965333 RepID=UPI001DA4F51F|nr:sulfatase-like hydrolase/transferase [Prosthecobacter sp.]MCB1276768.1 sulfatase-like hydrolase/transferase [Prosthecobacter sp.]
MNFIRPLVFITFALSLTANSVSAAEKPNVIVIMTDDQGADDAGCYGAKDIETPNIDAIAASGVRFTQFYSGAPVCSPSRAALLTGRYPLRAGLVGNAGSQHGGKGVPTEQVTMAEMFKASGYSTAQIGKWHLGYRDGETPNAQGFDHAFGHMGGCIDNFSHFFYWQGPNVHDLWRNGTEVFHPGRYFADLMVEEASRFIEQNRKQPFFIYFALNMPHYPYQGDVKWLERYKDLPYPRNLYSAFLSSCDERIGALMKKLDDLDLRKNTIVVLQSDNGHSTEERAHFGGGSAGPYRGAKFSLFEGGMHLPGLISWPGHLPEGVVREQMVHSCDWLPTLGKLCDVKLLNEDIDGKDITSVIESADAPSPHSELHWLVGGGKRPQWAVRQGQWKLIGNVQDTSGGELSDEDKKFFLSDLATDISEKTNHAKEHPEIVAKLLKLHEDWVASYTAPESTAAPVQDSKGNEK